MADNGLWTHIAVAADTLGFSQYQVRCGIARGEIPGEKIGGRVYVASKWLEVEKARIAAMIEAAMS
jgi:hypothetical protein